MFNWFKKKNKDEENKKVQEEKIDILTKDADAAQINEDAGEICLTGLKRKIKTKRIKKFRKKKLIY